MVSPSDFQPNTSRFHAFVVVEEWRRDRADHTLEEPFVSRSFTLDKEPWGIVWSSRGGGMSITVRGTEDSGDAFSAEVMNTSQEGQGISYVECAGTFRLAIQADGQWVVKVVAVD